MSAFEQSHTHTERSPPTSRKTRPASSPHGAGFFIGAGVEIGGDIIVKEGERETPPILEAAFVRSPLARKGWELMTPTQRRGHLWGISYYRSPESRQKRAAKAVAEAVRIAKSKGKPGQQKLGPEL